MPSSAAKVLSSVDVFRFAEQARQHKAANEAYLQGYPELKQLLFDLTRACLVEKPHDVRAFAADFVANYAPSEADKGQVAPDLGITAKGYVKGLASGALGGGESLELDDDDEDEDKGGKR